ncbi:hypothetical protein J4558_06065 [Leptolyngbya sp. 15MV]|nr:hypothetical protein J4558_06065 [Leptolyngbya sp. 15MV]
MYPTYEAFYRDGPFAPYVREARACGTHNVSMFEIAQPAGDFSDPAVPDLVLIQERSAGARVEAELGAGPIRRTLSPGHVIAAVPLFASRIVLDAPHRIRICSLPMACVQAWFAESGGSIARGNFGLLHQQGLRSPFLNGLLDRLWAAGRVPAGRLHADALTGALLGELAATAASASRRQLARGGLAPHILRRVCERMADDLADDVGLEALAAIADLSPFHFARDQHVVEMVVEPGFDDQEPRHESLRCNTAAGTSGMSEQGKGWWTH